MGGVVENGLLAEEVVTLTTGGVKRGVLWGDGCRFNVGRHDGGGRGSVDGGPGAVGGGPRYGIEEETGVCGLRFWFRRGDITEAGEIVKKVWGCARRELEECAQGTTRSGERSDQKVLSDTKRKVEQPCQMVRKIVIKACDQTSMAGKWHVIAKCGLE